MTTQFKLVLGFATLFLAGAVVGGSLGYTAGKSKAPKPPLVQEQREKKGGGHGRDRGDFTERMCARLEKDLNLTPEQVARIKPIYETTELELKAVNAENFDRIRAIFRASHEKIKPVLTEEQRLKFEEKNREREMRFKKHSQDKPPKC